MNAYDHAVAIARIASDLEDAIIAHDYLTADAWRDAIQTRLDSLAPILREKCDALAR